MRVFNQGSFYRVTVSEYDVARFAKRWPCFGPHRPLSFTFDKRAGNLVDMGGDDRDMDESGVLALSEDAMRYGAKRLRLDLPR